MVAYRGNIVSLNIGKPSEMIYNRKKVNTGIFKSPTDDSMYLSLVNLHGDGQADLVHHGGPEKAVCVYPYEHYPFWERTLSRELPCGAFGENITSENLLESRVCIGDIFEWGAATVQVSQPRQPCYKLSARYERPDIPPLMQNNGFTGFYFRVLKEGLVSASDPLTLSTGHPLGVTVAFANRIMHRDKDDLDGIRALLSVAELSFNWRHTLGKQLEDQQTDTRERLNGPS